MRTRRTGAVLSGMILVAALTATAAEPPTVAAADAIDHVGKRVKVCGEIASVGRAFAKRDGGKQVFLHFDKEPPNSPFVAVVIGRNLEAYLKLDNAVHRKACAVGYVKQREGMIYTIIDAINQFAYTDSEQQ
jgi:hypothetical protein